MTSFRAWLCTLKVYTQPASLRMLALGFSAGLPLLLVLGTLSFWLREAGIDRTTIGYLSWVGLAYAFKWVWAPLVDRLPLPGLTRRLGRRRSWLLLSQLLIAACMALLLWGSWEQVVAGWNSYSTVLGYPLALGAAATLVLAIGMLLVVVRDMLRGTPTESSETSVE